MVKIYSGTNKINLIDKANHDFDSRNRDMQPVVFKFSDDKGLFPFSPIFNDRIPDIGTPFSLIAHTLWTMSGDTSIEWMNQFLPKVLTIDDQKHVPFSIGERLTYWNKNNHLNFIFNPIDQLSYSFEKLKRELNYAQESSSSVCQLYNPEFDNDISDDGHLSQMNPYVPLTLTFDYHHYKLNISVHYQCVQPAYLIKDLYDFSLIHHVMSSWLSKEYIKMEKGDLLIYIDHFKNSHAHQIKYPVELEFFNEPKYDLSKEKTNDLLTAYYGSLDHLITSLLITDSQDVIDNTVSSISGIDGLFRETIISLVACRLTKEYEQLVINNGEEKKKDKILYLMFYAISLLETDWKLPIYLYLITNYGKHQLFKNNFNELVSEENKKVLNTIKHFE